MDDDNSLYDDLEQSDSNGSAPQPLDKPATTDTNGTTTATTSERRPSLTNDDTDDISAESGRTRDTNTSAAASASSHNSFASSPYAAINNPDKLDDSSFHFLRFRALYSASPPDLLALLEPQKPATLYSYLSSQGRRTGDHFASFAAQEDRDAVLSRELTVPFVSSGGRVDAYASSKREQLAAERRSRGTDKRTREDSICLALKGIPFVIREDGIEQWLREHEVRVVDVHIAEDAVSGRVAGDALVEVEDEEAAVATEKLTRSTLQNRYVDVVRLTAQQFEEQLHPSTASSRYGGSTALRRPPSDSDSHSRSSYGRDGRDERGGRDRDSSYEYGAVPPSSGPLVHQLPRLAPSSTDCLFMQGLPIGCQQADVVAFFGELSIVPRRIHRKERGPDAFIEFRTVDEAERAMQLKRRHMGSRWIDLIRVTYTDMCKITGLTPTRDNVVEGVERRTRDDRDKRRGGSSRERDDGGRAGYSDRGRDRDREYEKRDDRYQSSSVGGSAAGGDRYRERSRSPAPRRRDDDYGSRSGSDRDGGRGGYNGRSESSRDARGGGGASSHRGSDRGYDRDRSDRDRDGRDEYRSRR